MARFLSIDEIDVISNVAPSLFSVELDDPTLIQIIVSKSPTSNFLRIRNAILLFDLVDVCCVADGRVKIIIFSSVKCVRKR